MIRRTYLVGISILIALVVGSIVLLGNSALSKKANNLIAEVSLLSLPLFNVDTAQYAHQKISPPLTAREIWRLESGNKLMLIVSIQLTKEAETIDRQLESLRKVRKQSPSDSDEIDRLELIYEEEIAQIKSRIIAKLDSADYSHYRSEWIIPFFPITANKAAILKLVNDPEVDGMSVDNPLKHAAKTQ